MHCLYRHFSEDGTLLYVGISINGFRRLADHRHHAHWFEQIRTITLEMFPSRQSVIQAEREAIASEGPKHNRMVPFFCANRSQGLTPTEIRSRIPEGVESFSPRELGPILGISLDKTRRLLDEEQITYLRVGKVKRVVTRSGLIQYVESLERAA